MKTLIMEPLLRVVAISKSFGTLPVIHQVSFEVNPGEVMGVTGSIGSGKSVLMMVLAGLYEPSAGEVYFNHKRLKWPFTSQSQGIGVVHQRPTLNDLLDVVDNIFLGNEMGWPPILGELKIVNRFRMHQEAARILDQLGVHLNSLHEKVTNLTGEQRQMIAIARALTYPARMVIIDEPTVLLSYPNQQRLLEQIQRWRQQGVAVLFSSNNINHLFAITDRILILNQGRMVADLRTEETTQEAVSALLLGMADPQKSAPTLWDYDSYNRIRENAEMLRYSQILMGKDSPVEPTFQRQLTEQLTEQVQALDQANLALIEAHRRLHFEREQDRKQVARELHDQVIQELLSINYDLEGMESEQMVSAALASDLSDVRQGIRDLIDNLRRICGDLRPPTIDSLGLGAALQSYTRAWSGRTGIQVELNLDENLGRLPEATELSLYRIVQEGLNNVWRHAEASVVQISLEHTSLRTLKVAIRDNGLGLKEDLDLAALAANGHYGLLGINERVALLAGRFRIQRLPEGGSLMLVEIPHPRVSVNQELNR